MSFIESIVDPTIFLPRKSSYPVYHMASARWGGPKNRIDLEKHR